MRATAVRIGQMFSRPAVVIPLLAVPLLAGGLHALATDAADSPGGTFGVSPSASQSTEADPSAPARAALDRTEIPLGLLESGFGRLTDGAGQLDDGAGQLSDGITRAREGSTELATGLDQLNSGLGELGDGSARLNEGVSALVGALTGAAAVQGQAVQILTDTINDLSAVDDEAAHRAVDQLTALRDVVQANGTAADLPARLEEMRAGSEQITFQLDNPDSPFAGGLNRATDGAGQLRDGLVALDDGGHRLTDGTDELVTSVQPVDGVLASLTSGLDETRAALPVPATTPAASAADTRLVSSTSILPTFPIAVLILIGSTLAALSTGRRVLLPAALTGLCGWVAVAGSGISTTPGALAGTAAVIAVSVAAITATTRAILVSTGPGRGRWIASAIVAVQVLIGAIALIGDDRAARVLSMFTPIGWVSASLSAAIGESTLRELAVPLLISGTAFAIALSILTAARAVPDKPAPEDERSTGLNTDSGPTTNDPNDDGIGDHDLEDSTADALALVSAGQSAPDDAESNGGHSNSDSTT